MEKYSVFHGRFQPFHLGHSETVKLLLKQEEDLIIAIANPYPKNTIDFKTFALEKNPFNFWERYRMIHESLIAEKVDMNRIMIIPYYFAGLFSEEKCTNYEPTIDKLNVYINIVTDWDIEKIDLWKKYYKELKIIEHPIKVNDILITATEIRKRMRNNGNWKEMVPEAVTKIIKEMDLIKRVK